MTSDESRALPASANADDLLRHAAWLRALARTLVGEADADDVVQETWVAAVARRPGAVHSLRAWLGAVARNVVRQNARAAVRRREREVAAAAAAPSSDAPSTDEVVARAARMRELVERVLSLDEPYRSTILLRFFEGVRPQEIARRVGASEEAVRQRLKRGLDRLREQLDAEHGGERERWIAGMAPLTAAAPAPWLVAKGAAMGVSTKFAASAALLVVAIGAVVLLVRSGSETRRTDAGAVARADAPKGPDAPLDAVRAMPVAATREADTTKAAERVADSGAVDPRPVRFVYGAVVDADGQPLGAILQICSAEDAAAKGKQAKAKYSAHSSDGAWSMGGIEAGRWRVVASHDGCPDVVREFTIDESAEGRRVDLVFGKPISIPVRFVALDGRPLGEVMTSEDDRKLLELLSVLGLSSAPPPEFEPSFSGVGGRSGSGAWCTRPGNAWSLFSAREQVAIPDGADGVLIPPAEAPKFVAVALASRVLASAPVVEPSRRVDLVVDPERVRSIHATIRVRLVTAESARPIEGVTTMLNYGYRCGPNPAQSNHDGRLTLEHVMPGELELELMARDRQRFVLEVTASPGEDVDLGTIELSESIKLRGRMARSDGGAIDGSVVAIDLGHWRHGLPMPDSSSIAVERDGRFELWSLGRGPYLVLPRVTGWVAAPIVVDPLVDAVRPIEIALVQGTEVRFRQEGPLPLQPPTYEIDDEHGTLVHSKRSFPWTRLPQGKYRLVVWRGGTSVAAVPFEVGESDLVVPVPRIDDPNGLTRAAASESVEVATGDFVAPRIVGDPVGVVAVGRVVGGEERGVDEGSAGFTSVAQERRTGTMHDGCFAVAGMRAGRIERQLYGRNGSLPFLDQIVVADTPRIQRRDFRIETGAAISVVVVDAATGGPILRVPQDVRTELVVPRFSVIATKDPPPASVPVVDPDWNFAACYETGRFTWSDPDDIRKPGFLDVSGPFPLHVSLVCGGRVLHTEQLAAPVKELRLPLDWNSVKSLLASVRFQLVDAETGQPLQAAAIQILNTSMSMSMGSGSAGALPFDFDGGYLRARIPAGERKLWVAVAGYESIDHDLFLTPGEVTDLGTIALGRPRHGHGTVVDEKGRPVKAMVRRFDSARASAAVPLHGLQYLDTTEDGRFEFDVGSGALELRVLDAKYAATTVALDPSREPIDDVKIVLASGTPVTLRPPQDLARVTIVVEDADGRTVASSTLRYGALRLRLRPGAYVAAAVVHGERTAETDFEVAGVPLEVELRP